MTKDEKKDEMKNRISMALKDPILQQCFEIICKNLTVLEQQIADIKANCDLAIEGREVKIKELEQKNKELEKRLVSARAEFLRQYKENAELKKKCYKKAVKDYCELEKENAGLKARLNAINLLTPELEKLSKAKTQQLTKAKEIIKNCIHILKHSGTALDWKTVINQAEQFLKGENIILEDVQAGNSSFDADEVFNKEMKAYSDEK